MFSYRQGDEMYTVRQFLLNPKVLTKVKLPNFKYRVKYYWHWHEYIDSFVVGMGFHNIFAFSIFIGFLNFIYLFIFKRIDFVSQN